MKIISGGQTGVDRAALDFAIRHGYEHGGWCPHDRRAENGVSHDRCYDIESLTRKKKPNAFKPAF